MVLWELCLLCFNMAPTHDSYSPSTYTKKQFSLPRLILHCSTHIGISVLFYGPSSFTNIKSSWFKKIMCCLRCPVTSLIDSNGSLKDFFVVVPTLGDNRTWLPIGSTRRIPGGLARWLAWSQSSVRNAIWNWYIKEKTTQGCYSSSEM